MSDLSTSRGEPWVMMNAAFCRSDSFVFMALSFRTAARTTTAKVHYKTEGGCE